MLENKHFCSENTNEKTYFFFSGCTYFSTNHRISLFVDHVGDEGGESVHIEIAMAAFSGSREGGTNRQTCMCLVSHPLK